jgi:hypothetical protein
MPTYRVYYAERMPHGARDWMRALGARRLDSDSEEIRHREIAWEEELEARNPAEALDAFFREHVPDRTQVMWVDDTGQSHEFQGLDYDPDKTYIWIEDDKLMEYQGVDEATPGMVTCPLCGGEGEVAAEVAEEFIAEDEEEEEGWS